MLPMTVAEAQRHLVLLRHAKSAYPHGVPDHDRPLAGKGRRNAAAAGDWFRGEGPRPDLVICSDAQRARHTWEIVSSRLDSTIELQLEPRLYGATPGEVITIARGCAARDDAVHTLVVVGHEPTLSTTALLLAGDGSEELALESLATKFPTSAVAVLTFTGSWADLSPGLPMLTAFAVPRA